MINVSFLVGKTNEGIENYQIVIGDNKILSKIYNPEKQNRQDFFNCACEEFAKELSLEDNLHFTGNGLNGYVAKEGKLEKINEIDVQSARNFYETLQVKLIKKPNLGIVGGLNHN